MKTNDKSGSFSSKTIQTLSKRAALRCSNPDCGTLTSGPSSTSENGTTNIGEAAHIFGRTVGSARYRPEMNPSERSDITNAIWLCRNCHKKVDNNPIDFPSSLLFEWRRLHERETIKQIGTKGLLLQQDHKMKNLAAFEKTSHLAQQIVFDRPDFWEHKLTAELLRNSLAPILSKLDKLQNGLYTQKLIPVPEDELRNWFSKKMDEAVRIIDVLMKLISNELPKSMSEPKKENSEQDILGACQLLEAAANNLLEWEEDLQFSFIPDEFEELKTALAGICSNQLQEIMKIPTQISKVLENEQAEGTYSIRIVFALPEDFETNFYHTLDRCLTNYQHSNI